MSKQFIISIDVYENLKNDSRNELKKYLIEMKERGNNIIFTSIDYRRSKEIADLLNKGIEFKNRDLLKSNIKNKEIDIENIIFIGNKNYDLIMAATNKSFFIVPMWCNEIQEKADKYGLKISSIENLKKVIAIILNQKNWFYELDVDNKTKVLSLTSANTIGIHSSEEIELINGFREYLKRGGYKYYSTLLYHFLSGIVNKPEFRNIQDWSIIPSSGTELNREMLLFKEKARYLMNGRKKDNIFIRHTKTWKSHEAYIYGYDRIPCDRHFNTIMINPLYKGKLKNRIVCIFDDYSTNGTSFEVARNLLLKENVKKIYCVSLGKFGVNSPYVKQDYELEGNLYSKGGYKYNLIDKKNIYGNVNKKSISEIEKLYHIIYD
ncbi:hypothetical protein J2Z53_001466 [Clostridium moniliforme]|uniref:Phosphoribosyl transferase n=1 Tax=Clostridium moniliforme TaxID=39489 RepID=A0ABS4F0V1_9CLOT|nr:phosphoribosyltransferase [Clostridium moniliforme]MBP1889883.1 hypothetical protein [Clostridium moniliforme]